MPAPRALELAQLHTAALEAAAAHSGTSLQTTLNAFLSRATKDIVSWIRKLGAREAASAVALVAMSELRCQRGSLSAALVVEKLSDALLRDCAYRVHRLGQTLSAIAEAQGIRELTVRQNLRRLERLVSREVLVSLALSGTEPALSEGDIEKAIAKPKKAKAEGRMVASFACAAWQEARETIVGIGPRSVKGIQGRPWIEPTMARRPAGSQVAEERGVYGNVRSFDVRKEDQGWAARVAISSGRTAITLVMGSGIAVISGDGQTLGTITPDAPSIALPGITLPAELHLRKLGTAN